MPRILAPLIALCLLLPSGGSAAEETTRYEAEVPVPTGEAAEAQGLAIDQALRQVMVKVSGRRHVLEREAARPILEQAEGLVRQYRYRTSPADASTEPQRRLWVRFDHEALEMSMRRAGLPVWSGRRPVTLVWLALDTAGGRTIVSGEGPAAAVAAIESSGSGRDIPLLLPILDVEDRQSISVSDIWGRFAGVIERASRRYGSEAILAGRVYAAGTEGGWRADWTLIVADETDAWANRGDSLAAAVGAGVDRAADTLAHWFSDEAQVVQESGLRLTVDNIRALRDYGSVLQYLGSVSGVDAVRVAEVNGARVSFELRLGGSEEALLRVLALEGRMQRLPGERGPDGDEALLYRWLP